jgi:hypothetical protein
VDAAAREPLRLCSGGQTPVGAVGAFMHDRLTDDR